MPTHGRTPPREGEGHQRMRRLAAESLSAGDPLGWYERLYADGSVVIPWDHREPTPYLIEWLDRRFPAGGESRRAVVVGCAYGDDAELVARHGFLTTAFDIAGSAVAEARRRHPGSPVHYRRADLLDLPQAWGHSFDVVIECATLQSLAPQLHQPAARGVASLCAPGGRVLVVARIPEVDEETGPPWLLSRAELEQVATAGLVVDSLDRVAMRGGDRWVAEFRRPLAA